MLRALCLLLVALRASARGAFPLIDYASDSKGDHELSLHPCARSALLSPLLNESKLRVIAVVGPARKGKSFFLSMLANRSGAFASSDSILGFTRGLWLLIDGVDCVCGSDGAATVTARGKVEPLVTAFLDTEGLGALRSTENGDTKVAALATLLSSVVLYNVHRNLDQGDVKFMRELVEFDQVFQQMAFTPLLRGAFVWVLQSFSSNHDCGEVAHEIGRALLPEEGRLLLSGAEPEAYCLPSPVRGREDRDVASVQVSELDAAYSQRLAQVLQRTLEGEGQHLPPAHLVGLLERVIPALNDMTSTARALVAFQASVARKSALKNFDKTWCVAEGEAAACGAPAKEEANASEALEEFDALALGRPTAAENQLERELSATNSRVALSSRRRE
jgi:hypothetical protein